MPATELTFGVTLAVLAAGLLHASWNALLKGSRGGDPLLDMALVVAGSSVTALALMPFVALPDPAAWKFVAASTAIHIAYYATLVKAYQIGDLSFAYPLMRGTAPLITTALGVVFLAEWPTPQVGVGILLISAGIVSIAFVQRHRHPPAAAGWALANAAVIAGYTLVDAAGARASGSAASYVVWLTFIDGFPLLIIACQRRGRGVITYFRRGWHWGLAGGAASLAAYGIVLWAMTRAPVAAVAALRETSVLFAALIGAIWLKEGFSVPRFVGTASVVLGIAALKL